MKKSMKINLLLLSFCGLAHAEISWVNQPVQQALVDTSQFVNKSRQSEQPAISYNQPLLGTSGIEYQNQGFAVASKQFWLDTNANELSKGLTIPLTSEIAIIRINPLDVSAQTKSVAAEQLELSIKGHTIEPAVFVDANQLKATGMPVSEHTVAFKVEAQPGNLLVKLNGLTKSNTNYVLHVFEPESEHVLKLSTTHQRYDSGADVVIITAIETNQSVQAMKVDGYLTNPLGEKVADLKFKADQQGGYQAVIPKMQGQSLQGGLWEVHTVTESQVNGLKVMRDASTAFAVNMATARFSGSLGMDEKQISVGIENALPARYEIRGILYGTDHSGDKQPIALMMSAKWLNTGDDAMSFELPINLIEQSGLKAPYTVEQLELKNQTDLVPVQMEINGFEITELSSQVSDFR
ncbi:MAG: hypothetical protein R3E90_05240 [Marinicella sp.]